MNLKNTTKPLLSKLKESDIPGLIELSASVGWDYDREEINTILASGIIYGHTNKYGKIISSAAIIPYGSKLASIGMVIVDQNYRGLGLGKEATQKCIESISSNMTSMLIATEDGMPMYEKMGFISRDVVHKFICDDYVSVESNIDTKNTTSSIKQEDLPYVIKLDKAAFGVERTKFLINRVNQSKDGIVVKNQEGKISGYGLSIKGPVNLILGPIVAEDTETAILIVDKLMDNHQGRFRIDVPSGDNVFMTQLEKRGFVKVNQPPIMINNSHELPQRNGTLFGIAAQIFG